ncbi:SUN domain-containing protein 1 isoform X9 [Canis lupus familiaris]|uniref:Sad1 and UNC84 domain containing 1 n=1 Tax=Canis lupus familiaris TaxID=9615 RepID=A0A8P0P8X2_CANLF|nr:SUN domain-containing protein 1 isoform X9 [Canis lupus familiaris]|eukprot:XP_005621274.1 SUN domain-containing protein 1 isoform X10 [Canis lupus familiaris]
MDFSRLHMYTPPQCVPENTGYTYALSSSYSSDALAFETEHRLDPVFDSPRMSRRSLRLVTTACATEDGQARDTHSCASSTASLKDRAARTVKQRRSASKPAFSINHTSRKVVSCGVGQSGTSTLSSAACLRPPVLDESLIREQTKVDHFWGLDDDGDLKGGNKAATQGNGDLAAEAARSNGYTCSDCLLLSERKDTLTAHSATHGPSPRLYSRDQGQKRKAASGIFWWLGIGWYQFVTLISWLNVFLLTRCLRNICKFLILLIPLLLLLGGGLSLWGQGDFLSGLPVFNWTRIYGTQRVDSPESMFTPDASQLSQDGEAFHEHRMSEVERQMTSLSGQCHSHEEKLRELATVLQTLQARVDQMDGDGEATLSLVQRVVGQHLKEISADGLSDSQTDTVTFRQEHELRLSNLEDILGKLTQTSEAIQKELEQTKLRTASGAEEEQRLLSVVKHLEEELGHLKSELSSWQHLKTSCEEVDTIHGKVDAQVRETVKLMFSDGEQGGSLKWLLQTVSSQFVSRDDLQVLLRDLELQILKNITHYISVTKQVPDSETVVSAANEAGISGITEAQARVIVNNALKLYSQDKTGMVDFALESGGGSILSTRCSETYETKTALISLFGIPLWYFSQSPRVVIQPDIHPGNCWAFRGSQGYLVVRLSMKIRPTAFTLEHIPKTLSPTGNITSAPKDFAVYGLEDEYQEEGQLLGQFTYDQEGESLQMFHVPKRPEGAFQIVELRIFSNWGHPEYTCLYRFRVHGEPIK